MCTHLVSVDSVCTCYAPVNGTRAHFDVFDGTGDVSRGGARREFRDGWEFTAPTPSRWFFGFGSDGCYHHVVVVVVTVCLFTRIKNQRIGKRVTNLDGLKHVFLCLFGSSIRIFFISVGPCRLFSCLLFSFLGRCEKSVPCWSNIL